MVVMDPRMSNSAGMADLWIAAWPGTEPVVYLYLVNRILQEGKVDKKFVKKWFNWDVLMNDDRQLNLMVEKGYISKLPADKSFESYMELMKELYAPYTLEFAVKETHVPAYKLEKLYEMFIWAGDAISTYIWRATAAGNRGGWMSGRAAYLAIALRGVHPGSFDGARRPVGRSGRGRRAGASTPNKTRRRRHAAGPIVLRITVRTIRGQPDYPMLAAGVNNCRAIGDLRLSAVMSLT